MNKRQAKKAFKKKYGYNPPVTNGSPPHWRTTLLKKVLPAACEGIKRGLEAIRTMPEEEFKNRIIEGQRAGDVSPQQAAMAYLIRITGKRKG